MNFKRSVKGTILEAPARSLRKALVPRSRGTEKARSSAELRLLACETHPASLSENASIFFFTTHKCASTFVNRLLSEIGRTGPRSHFHYPGAMWDLGDALRGEEPYELLSSRSNHLFFPHGEIYGPLRRPIDVQQGERYRTIFFLRDPRDVLVSAYYSFGFSHPEPANSEAKKRFLKNRKKIQEEGIDRYALREATEWLAPIYSEYDSLRRSSAESCFIRYDDYTSHTEDTIKRIFAFCDTPIEASRVLELSAAAAPIAAPGAGETVLRHKRSGRSGQFKAELKAETVDRLNDIFAHTLSTWGFAE